MILALGVVAALLGAAYVFTLWQSRRLERMYPPRGSFIEVDGERLHYGELRPDGAPRGTILLLHGASGNFADVMGPLGAPLAAQGFRVIAFDRPGHGYSTRPRGGQHSSPAAQARLIRTALEKLGVHEAIVLGHSLAGALAAHFAIAHRDFTRGLVLVAPVTHPWPGGVTWYYTMASAPVIGTVFANVLAMPLGLLLMRGAIGNIFAPQDPPPDYIARIGAPLVLRPRNFVANAQDVARLKPFIEAQAKSMGEIEAPTAIITGTRDRIVYAHLHALGSARDVPDADLVILPNVGHAVQNVEPEIVVESVLAVARRAGL